MTKYVAIRVKTDNPDIQLPSYAHENDAGADLRASADVTVWPYDTAVVPTGIRLEIPPGYEVQCRSRSGLAAKYGVHVLNSPGTIDADYTGEIAVILHNSSIHKFEVKRGDRIAQLVLSPVTKAAFSLTDAIGKTERGDNGFGSTGLA